MSLRHLHKSKAALWVGGVAGFAGGVGVVLMLVDRVKSGRGLDHYIAMSGYEWSAVPALVMVALAFAVILVGGLIRWITDRQEERNFVATIRRRIAARCNRGQRVKGRIV